MSKAEHIRYWMNSAQKDEETMRYLLDGGKYVHALFFGHLYLEKILKAHWIMCHEAHYPPKIHNLLSLLKLTDITLSEEYLLFLLKLNQYQIEGRYPEDIEKLYRITDFTLTNDYIRTINIIAKCLQEKLP